MSGSPGEAVEKFSTDTHIGHELAQSSEGKIKT